ELVSGLVAAIHRARAAAANADAAANAVIRTGNSGDRSRRGPQSGDPDVPKPSSGRLHAERVAPSIRLPPPGPVPNP
ncbi:MAG TPA: hypothetical protein VIT65_27120, partial [Microlunatus sp.]